MDKKEKLKLKPGFCPFTGKKIIKKRNGHTVKTINHSNYWLKLSDGSKMEIGVDSSVKLDSDKVAELMEAHRVYWKEGIEKYIDEKIDELKKRKLREVNYYENLDFVSFGKREKDLK